jgi:hypothetical protein
MRGASPPGRTRAPPPGKRGAAAREAMAASFARGIGRGRALGGIGTRLSRDGVESGRGQSRKSKYLTCMTPRALAPYSAGRRRGPRRHTSTNWAHVATSAGLRSRGLRCCAVHTAPATEASCFFA